MSIYFPKETLKLPAFEKELEGICTFTSMYIFIYIYIYWSGICFYRIGPKAKMLSKSPSIEYCICYTSIHLKRYRPSIGVS